MPFGEPEFSTAITAKVYSHSRTLLSHTEQSLNYAIPLDYSSLQSRAISRRIVAPLGIIQSYCSRDLKGVNNKVDPYGGRCELGGLNEPLSLRYG